MNNIKQIMKSVTKEKIIQTSLVFVIIAIYGNHVIRDIYKPKPIGDKGFPLELVWETKLSDNIQQVIALRDDQLLVRLPYSINLISLSTGESLWKYRSETPIYSIIEYKGKVYATKNYSLLKFDAENGDLEWQKSINEAQQIPILKFANENTLITASYNNTYIFNSNTGEIQQHVNSGRVVDICVYQDKFFIFNSYQDIKAYSLNSGNLLWEDNIKYYQRNLICKEGVAYLIVNDSNLVALNLGNQTQIWSRSLYSTYQHPSYNLFMVKDFLIVSGLDSSYVISKESGKLVHEFLGQNQITSTVAIKDNIFLFYEPKQAVYSYNSTWNNTGILQYSLPAIILTETNKLQSKDDYLILWKYKHLFAYK
jgi:outer membrane protein assembly factor BamB